MRLHSMSKMLQCEEGCFITVKRGDEEVKFYTNDSVRTIRELETLSRTNYNGESRWEIQIADKVVIMQPMLELNYWEMKKLLG